MTWKAIVFSVRKNVGGLWVSNISILDRLLTRDMIDEDKLPGIVQPDGKRCVKKVVNVFETKFDRGMDCHHRLKEKCHLTYITDYHSAPEEKCETTFRKDCHITFKPIPHIEKVKKCRIPYVKKCGDDIVGPEICKLVHETFCETSYKEYNIEQDEPDCEIIEEERCEKIPIDLIHLPHKPGQKPFAEKERCEKWPVKKCDIITKDVKKIHPNTECKKVARKVCAPSNCQIFPGEEICNDEKRTVIQNIPQEDCDLQPQRHCKNESSLVPRLVPKKNCIKVPKEICVNTRKNPKKISKAVVKNWCYDPKELKARAEE
ncbi:Uncharacterized protein FKW44_020101 [Caligus rogercresseyi]|uniref:Uncharacterized protein n=1 Tax=Caligus rogercresseyi TaxID=217165 RepID=A0A7T8GWT6_CALRO|nr:Uncharacterized protein FKW44_020101 [Caligus rogercresseyi]